VQVNKITEAKRMPGCSSRSDRRNSFDFAQNFTKGVTKAFYSTPAPGR
jgi:hypothetical protein